MSNRRTPSPPSGPTLLQILQLPNPKVKDKWTGSSYGNTKGTFDEIEFDNDHPSVQPWADFTFEAIYLAYGHLLDQKMTTLKPEYQLVVGPSPGQSMLISIKQETDVDNLGSAWSVNVLRAPIAVAATQLRSQGATQDSSQNGMTALCRERIYWVKPKVYSQGYTRLTPDWSILDPKTNVRYREDDAGESEKELAFAIGDSKLKQKWKSQWLALADDDLDVDMDMPSNSTLSRSRTKNVEEERLLPLRQIATYCRYAQTRYAFLMTQTELVALRIRRFPRQPSQTVLYACVEYVSVSWDASTGLTMNLAIWALGCMGMNDTHREMESSSPQSNGELTSMAKLTWWKHDAKSQLYENVISKRRIPEAEWKKLDTRFVYLDEKSGSSFTRDFLPVSLRAPTPTPTSTSSGIGSLPQKMGNLNLGGPALSRAPARPSARSSIPPAGPSQPSVPPANKPAGRTTRNSTMAGAPPTAPAGPPGPSGASASPPEPYCIINGRPYPAHYNKERNWEVTLNRQTFLIERDMQQRIHFVNHNGNILKVTKMPLPSG